MTAFTTYTDGTATATPAGQGAYASAPARVVLEGVYDASRRNMVAADTVDVITVPAGFQLEAVGYKILTAETTAAQTFNIGKTGTVAAYLAAGSSSAAAGTRGIGAVITSAVGELFAADTAVTVNMPATMVATNFKVRVFVIGTLLG